MRSRSSPSRRHVVIVSRLTSYIETFISPSYLLPLVSTLPRPQTQPCRRSRPLFPVPVPNHRKSFVTGDRLLETQLVAQVLTRRVPYLILTTPSVSLILHAMIGPQITSFTSSRLINRDDVRLGRPNLMGTMIGLILSLSDQRRELRSQSSAQGSEQEMGEELGMEVEMGEQGGGSSGHWGATGAAGSSGRFGTGAEGGHQDSLSTGWNRRLRPSEIKVLDDIGQVSTLCMRMTKIISSSVAADTFCP